MTHTGEWTEAERRRNRQRLGVEIRDDGTDYRGYIDDQFVEGALALVLSAEVLPKCAHWHTLERKGPGGRPAAYASPNDTDRGRVGNATEEIQPDGHDNRDQLILVCMLILQMLKETPQQESVVDLVMNRFSPYAKRLLGIPTAGARASHSAVKARIQRAWKRFTSVCDPFPTLSGGRRMPRAEVEAIQAALSPETSTRNMTRLRWLMNQLLEASIRLMDAETRDAMAGHISLDATPILGWGGRGHATDPKKRRPTDSMSPEWHAGWYHRHNEPLAWGYALHIAVATPDPYNPGRFPIIAVGASMDTPNKRSDENAVAICRSIVERGHPVGDMVTDRGYFSHCSAKSFNRPIEELGFRLIGDYKKKQRGLMGTYRGAIMVDGNLYSPNMPQHLIDASIIYDRDNDWSAYQRRIRQRSHWLIKRHDANRYICPALTERATVSCVLRPDGPLRAADEPSHKDHSVADEPPAFPGDICTQGSVKITREDLGDYEKYAQDLQYGSQEYEDRYRPARSMVEGFNGYTKDGKHEQLDKKENRRVRGFAANAIVAVIGLVATNIRKIRSFYANDKPLPCAPKPKPVKNAFTSPPAWVSAGLEHPGWGIADPPQPAAA